MATELTKSQIDTLTLELKTEIQRHPKDEIVSLPDNQKRVCPVCGSVLSVRAFSGSTAAHEIVITCSQLSEPECSFQEVRRTI
jgi:hypothetical protein